MTRAESFLEARFWLQLEARGFADSCVREFVFSPERKWRFDFCWPDKGIAVEVEGKTHTLNASHENDCAKFAVALISEWRVLRVTYSQVRDESAIRWLEQLFQTI